MSTALERTADDKTEKTNQFSSRGGFLTYAMYQHTDTS